VAGGGKRTTRSGVEKEGQREERVGAGEHAGVDGEKVERDG
jgi:hypothetical protein